VVSLPITPKIFEKEVKRGLLRTFPAALLYRHPDFPRSRIHSAAIKFMPTQGVDYLLLERKRNLAFEVKFTKGTTFEFSRLSEQQYKFLQEFEEKAGQGYLVIGITRTEVEVLLISFPDYRALLQRTSKKSINFDLDLEALGLLFIKLQRVQIRSNFYIDFTPLNTPQQKLDSF
jgi:penicillin-binding protein-related factor A (putative recombinase)